MLVELQPEQAASELLNSPFGKIPVLWCSCSALRAKRISIALIRIARRMVSFEMSAVYTSQANPHDQTQSSLSAEDH